MAVPNGHTLDILPELIEHFTENLLAGSSVQSQAAGRVVIDLAGGALVQAAQAAVIELVSGQFHLEGDEDLQGAPAPFVQGGPRWRASSFICHKTRNW